jgi:hypothetical protein
MSAHSEKIRGGAIRQFFRSGPKRICNHNTLYTPCAIGINSILLVELATACSIFYYDM